MKIIANDAPFNYSRLNNIGAHATSKQYLCLLNNDVEAIDPGWLADMMGYAVQPGVGCVGAELLLSQRLHTARRHHTRSRRADRARIFSMRRRRIPVTLDASSSHRITRRLPVHVSS